MKNTTKRVKRRFMLQLFLLRLFYRVYGNLFPKSAGNRAFELWFTSPKFKPPAYERAADDSAQHETIRVNELDVAVYSWQPASGEYNKTILFVHGWSGRGTQAVGFIQPLLDKGCRVVSFDAPAHGKTAGRQTSIMEFVDTMLALEKHLADKHHARFDAVITHSFGGMALAYAMSMGFKTGKAVLLCPPDSLELLLEGFQQTLTLPAPAMRVMVRKSFAAYGQITRDAVNMVNNARNIDCPALIIHDQDDSDVPVESSRRIAAAWPGSELVITQGLGHRRILRAPDTVEKVMDFLQ